MISRLKTTNMAEKVSFLSALSEKIGTTEAYLSLVV